jgi:hypothetical protein
MMDRRDFLKLLGLATAATAVGVRAEVPPPLPPPLPPTPLELPPSGLYFRLDGRDLAARVEQLEVSQHQDVQLYGGWGGEEHFVTGLRRAELEVRLSGSLQTDNVLDLLSRQVRVEAGYVGGPRLEGYGFVSSVEQVILGREAMVRARVRMTGPLTYVDGQS